MTDLTWLKGRPIYASISGGKDSTALLQMSSYAPSVIAFCVAQVIFWYKGNARSVYGVEWSPFRWWLTTSLVTNYITLLAWWRLVDVSDVWRAGVTWGVCSVVVDLALNTLYFGAEWRGIVALLLCALGAWVAHT